jgi:N-methylhydantoinase A
LGGGNLYRVSVDVGGTFTDLVALETSSGQILNIKVPSVPRSPEEGVLKALDQFLNGREMYPVSMIGHATTIATNAFFGQIDLDLPKMAFITTKGFRDVIEIGRQRRAEVYNLFFQRPKTLVERRYRYEVEERVDHHGNITTPLGTEEVKKALDSIEESGVEAVTIGFLNSYLNGAHEDIVLQMMKERFPDIYVSASHRVANGYREYERFSTALVNSTLMPIIHAYLTRLGERLRARNVSSPLYVMQSNGGMAKAEIVSEKPVTIVESGPASGVIAASWLGQHMGVENVMSFDMGGTTAKAGTIRGGLPEVVPEYEVAGKVHMGRLIKGSGYPVRFPFIDLAECSAGGGTIAWLDDGGALNVGPESAGALPGPACYGKGGREPTITDANLLLGRLNPESLLNGDMSIYPRNARMALNRIGRKLSMSTEGVATAIIRIANHMMSQILRIVSVERGFDPRKFSLVTFGGAGPMHACALAEELKVNEILVPPNPGMFSALGLLTADLFHDYSSAYVMMSGDVDVDEVEEVFLTMEQEGQQTLLSEGVEVGAIWFQRHLDLRYMGQSYELSIIVDAPFNRESLVRGVERYHERHQEIYGYSAVEESVEVVNVGLRAIGQIEKPELSKDRSIGEGSPMKVMRQVYFEGDNTWIDTPVYNRESLPLGTKLEGPLIIEQYDSTCVIYPEWEVSRNPHDVMILRRNRQ